MNDWTMHRDGEIFVKRFKHVVDLIEVEVHGDTDFTVFLRYSGESDRLRRQDWTLEEAKAWGEKRYAELGKENAK